MDKNMDKNGASHLRARFWNFALQKHVELSRSEITDDIAVQLIPQEERYQRMYHYLRANRASTITALITCLQAYQREHP